MSVASEAGIVPEYGDQQWCGGPPADAPLPEVASGGGEMATLISATDWSKTPLGPAEAWSPALRMIVGFMLANRAPLLLWWGPDYVSIYNDPYRPVLGTKHPWALGKPFRECWAEIRGVLEPLIDTPFHGGPATWMDDIQLEINRYGFLEETHFTIAYSPVPDDTADGGIGGVLAIVHEITEKIVGERRLATLRDLGARTGEARTANEACAIAAETLGRHAEDIPFALLYLIDPDGKHARLAGASGIGAGKVASAPIVEFKTEARPGEGWPLAAAMRDAAIVRVDDLAARFAEVPRGSWPNPPETAVIVPVRSTKVDQLAGWLIVGVSPRLRLSEQYLSFLALIAAQVATAVATARAYEEERKRAEAHAEIAGVEGTLKLARIRNEAARELHASEKRYRELVEQMPDGIFLADGAGRYVDVNPAGCAMLRMTREEVLRRSFADVLAPEEHQRIVAEVTRFDGGNIIRSEWRMQRLDGSIFNAEIVGRRLPNGQLQSVIRDVTDRVRVAAVLRAGEERQAFLLKFSDTLRPLADPAEVQRQATRLLGEYLKADRCGYAETNETSEFVTLLHDYRAPGVQPVGDVFRLDDFGQSVIDILRRGKTLVIDDVWSDPRLADPAVASSFVAVGVTAAIAVPLMKAGRYAATLFVHQNVARAWAASEVALTEDVAERTWAAVEQARAETRIGQKNAVLEGINRIFGEALSAGSEEDLARVCLSVAEDVTQAGLSFMGEMNFMTNRLDEVTVSERGRKVFAERDPDVLSRTAPARLGMDTICEQVLAEGKGLIVKGPVMPRKRIATPRAQPVIKAFMGVPLILGGRTFGMMGLANRRGGFRAEDLEAAEALAPAVLQALLSKRGEAALRRSEEHLRLLVGELNHRVKNTLATVQSFALQSLRGASSLAAGRAAFDARLIALSKAHDVLVHEHWEGADLHEVVSAALAPYFESGGRSRLAFRGPDIRLQPMAALALSMALHELATNAIKHGALSAPHGRIEVNWQVLPSDEGGEFNLRWVESGGPIVVPPLRRGFGSRLIEQGLAQDLTGEVALEFESGGVVCTVRAPLYEIRVNSDGRAA